MGASLIQFALDYGLDNYVYGPKEGSAMHAAAARDFPRAIYEFSSQGLDVAVLDSTGYTPLHEAAAANSVDALQALIDCRADVCVSNARYGDTPLHWAAGCGASDALNFLLDHRADPSAVAGRPLTP